MSMLTLNGTLTNIFHTPAKTDPKTGRFGPLSVSAQVLAENTLESGEKRFEMVTIKVHAPDAFKALQGKFVQVPVGAFVADGQVRYYALKNDAQPQA